MRTLSTSYDDGLLIEEEEYSIGTSAGSEWNRVVYKGTKLMNGKPMMVFKTEDNERLTINPSFHTFTITHNKGE